MKISDKDNVISGGLKNPQEFEKLFKKYYAPLVVYANKYLMSLELSREVVQDFFVKLYEKSETLSIDISIKSYLYKSVSNCCINYLNQKNIQEKHLKRIDQERNIEENFENDIHSVELQNKIYQVIENLPSKCRLIFKLNRYEGLKNDEIAEQLKLSKRTVETQISKALKILRSKLSDYFTD